MSNLATPKQRAFIDRMMTSKDTPTEWCTAYAERGLNLTAASASKLIAALIALPEPAREDVPPGYHLLDDKVYTVAVSKNTGRQYAKVLNGTRWEYAKGAIYRLSADTVMDADTAAAYGRRTGVCAVCGRELTNSESVARGIGPICLNRF